VFIESERKISFLGVMMIYTANSWKIRSMLRALDL